MYKINCYNVIKEEAKKLLTSEYIETSFEARFVPISDYTWVRMS